MFPVTSFLLKRPGAGLCLISYSVPRNAFAPFDFVGLSQLLLLQYTSFSTSDRKRRGPRTTGNAFITRGASIRSQSSPGASSRSSFSSSSFPSTPLASGLLLPTPDGARSVDGFAIGNRGSDIANRGSAAATPFPFSAGFAEVGVGGDGGGGAGSGRKGAVVVGRVSERREGASVGEKVVARALRCLEGMCCSKQCERFMTPLAREVRFEFLSAAQSLAWWNP